MYVDTSLKLPTAHYFGRCDDVTRSNVFAWLYLCVRSLNLFGSFGLFALFIRASQTCIWFPRLQIVISPRNVSLPRKIESNSVITKTYGAKSELILRNQSEVQMYYSVLAGKSVRLLSYFHHFCSDIAFWCIKIPVIRTESCLLGFYSQLLILMQLIMRSDYRSRWSLWDFEIVHRIPVFVLIIASSDQRSGFFPRNVQHSDISGPLDMVTCYPSVNFKP